MPGVTFRLGSTRACFLPIAFFQTDFVNNEKLNQLKELSFCHKLKYSKTHLAETWCCKPLIIQAQNIWSNRIHSLKNLGSPTFGSKDIVIRNQSLWQRLNSFGGVFFDLHILHYPPLLTYAKSAIQHIRPTSTCFYSCDMDLWPQRPAP